MHVLTAEVLDLIEGLIRDTNRVKPTLSDAVARLPSRGKYLAYKLDGVRYNLGVKYGVLKTQLAIGLSGRDRDEILTELLDLMASRTESAAAR